MSFVVVTAAIWCFQTIFRPDKVETETRSPVAFLPSTYIRYICHFTETVAFMTCARGILVAYYTAKRLIIPVAKVCKVRWSATSLVIPVRLPLARTWHRPRCCLIITWGAYIHYIRGSSRTNHELWLRPPARPSLTAPVSIFSRLCWLHWCIRQHQTKGQRIWHGIKVMDLAVIFVLVCEHWWHGQGQRPTSGMAQTVGKRTELFGITEGEGVAAMGEGGQEEQAMSSSGGQVNRVAVCSTSLLLCFVCFAVIYHTCKPVHVLNLTQLSVLGHVPTSSCTFVLYGYCVVCITACRQCHAFQICCWPSAIFCIPVMQLEYCLPNGILPRCSLPDKFLH